MAIRDVAAKRLAKLKGLSEDAQQIQIRQEAEKSAEGDLVRGTKGALAMEEDAKKAKKKGK